MKFVSQGRVVDGKADDWEEEDLVCSSGSLKLYAYADAEGLDLLVTGAGEDSELYIPIDITDKSGSRSEKTRNLNFPIRRISCCAFPAGKIPDFWSTAGMSLYAPIF